MGDSMPPAMAWESIAKYSASLEINALVMQVKCCTIAYVNVSGFAS